METTTARVYIPGFVRPEVSPELSLVPVAVHPLSLKATFFSAVYLIYAAAALFIIFDHFFLRQRFYWSLPDSADSVKLFLVFFNVPHAVSGCISFFDKEYARAYRTPLILYLLIFVPVLSSHDPRVTYYAGILYVLWTVYHGFSQATGICRMTMGKVSALDFLAWRWSLVVVNALLMPITPYCVFFTGFSSISAAVVGIALAVNLCCAWRIRIWEKSRSCRALFGLTSSSAVALPLFSAVQYPFFMAVCGRFVHDVSAMAFYSTHDHNRAGHKPGSNRIYSWLTLTRIPIYVLCPLLGILFGLFNFALVQSDLGQRMLYGMAFFHYFMETWMWKRGSPHRNYIRMN